MTEFGEGMVGPAPPLKLIMLAGMRKVRSSECECRLASTLECPSACGLARGRASCDCCSSFFSLVECRVPRFLRSYKSLSIGLELLMIASTGSRLLIIYSPPLPFQPQHRSSNFITEPSLVILILIKEARLQSRLETITS